MKTLQKLSIQHYNWIFKIEMTTHFLNDLSLEIQYHKRIICIYLHHGQGFLSSFQFSTPADWPLYLATYILINCIFKISNSEMYVIVKGHVHYRF